MNALIENLKNNGQDFEWYPTTEEILKVFFKDYGSGSILDIGAGNGGVYTQLKKISNGKWGSSFYAIEKSQILISQMPADIFVVGTDFHQQTLIDKEVNTVFCNPPYSEYEKWAVKIIEQANCENIYLVIPERWKDSKLIKQAIKSRKWAYRTLGSFDFLNAERQARCKVNLLKLEKVEHFKSIYAQGEKRAETIDPFDHWFNTTFKITAKKDKFGDYKQAEQDIEKFKSEIVKGESLIPRLEELYNRDMQKLLKNYKSLENLDSDILKELNVNLDGLREGLKQRIEGLKNLYWQELFNNLDKITDRLTSKSRGQMLGTLTSNTSVDFTATNAYSVVIWVIKNANKYFDSQLLEMYYEISDKQNIRNYKSNKRIVQDQWRYCRDENKNSHYSLDYRIVTTKHGIWGEYSFNAGEFKSEGIDYVNDFITIAKNLGFEVMNGADFYRWERGRQVEIPTVVNNKRVPLMAVRAYKNGNIHFKFNIDFMRAFNIEAGRLNGWLKDPKHTSEELDIPVEEVLKYFKSNLMLLKNDVPLLENKQKLEVVCK